jgi:hypothetical protein
MAKRRSLSDSLTEELKPEEEVFLSTGRAKTEVASNPPPPVTEPLSTQQLLAVLPAFPNNARAPLNVRVHPDIARALMQASMVRKFQQLNPWSQQDIVSEALEHWLKTNRYLN